MKFVVLMVNHKLPDSKMSEPIVHKEMDWNFDNIVDVVMKMVAAVVVVVDKDTKTYFLHLNEMNFRLYKMNQTDRNIVDNDEMSMIDHKLAMMLARFYKQLSMVMAMNSNYYVRYYLRQTMVVIEDRFYYVEYVKSMKLMEHWVYRKYYQLLISLEFPKRTCRDLWFYNLVYDQQHSEWLHEVYFHR